MLGVAAARVAADHWPVLAVLGLALVVRLLVAIAYWPALFFSDSWAYLDAAYGTHLLSDRPIGYPFLLWAIALPGRSLATVTVLQHAAGLLTGGVAYALLRRLAIARWAATSIAALIVLDAYAIVLEQTILAEAFFTLALVLSAYLVIGRGRGATAIAAAGLLLGLAVTMRTAAIFAAVAWVAYVAWRHRRVGTVAVGVAALLCPLIALSAANRAAYGRWGLTAADGWFLYGRVGEIADCSAFDPPPGTEDLCESDAQRRRHGPIFYLWARDSPAVRKYGRPGAEGSSEPLRSFAQATIRARPAAYAGVVGRDVVRYFTPGAGSTGNSDTAITPPSRPRTGPPWINERIRRRHVPDFRPAVQPPSTFVRAYHAVVHPPRPLLGLLAVLPVVGLILRLARRTRWPMPHLPESLFLTGMGVAMLVGATATSGFIVRYLVPCVALIACGGAVAAGDLLAGRRAGAAGSGTRAQDRREPR